MDIHDARVAPIRIKIPNLHIYGKSRNFDTTGNGSAQSGQYIDVQVARKAEISSKFR